MLAPSPERRAAFIYIRKPGLRPYNHLYYSLCLISTVATKTILMYVTILKEEMLRECTFCGLRPE